MPDTTTENYDLIQPEVGGSNDTWGDKLNADLAFIDAKLKQLEDDVAATSGGLDALAPNSMIFKNSEGTVIALNIGAGTIVGRRSSGEIMAMTLADLKNDLGLNNVSNVSATTLLTAFTSTFDARYALKGDIPQNQPPTALDPTLAALAGLTVSDGQIIRATGSDAFETVAMSDFMAGLLSTASVGDLSALLGDDEGGGVEVLALSPGVPGRLKIRALGQIVLICWGSGFIGSNRHGTVTFLEAFASPPAFIASGGARDVGKEGGLTGTGATTTTGDITNSTNTGCYYGYIAIGQGAA